MEFEILDEPQAPVSPAIRRGTPRTKLAPRYGLSQRRDQAVPIPEQEDG